MNKFKLILFIFLIFFTSSLVKAQDFFTSNVEPRSGSIDDSFIFTVTIHGVKESPEIVLSDDFKIEFVGPQTRVTIINGEVNSEVKLLYRLTALKEGNLQSPTATLKTGGNIYTTKPITIKVSNDIQSQKSQRSGTKNLSTFLTQKIEKKQIYIGEQLVNTLELLTSTGIEEPQIGDLTFEGFLKEDFGPEVSSRRYINDKLYSVLTLRRGLFPLKSGDVTLPPQTVNAQVPVDVFVSSSPFDSFFNNFKFSRETFKSNTVDVKILPLPAYTGKKYNWSDINPLVGLTSVSVEVNPQDIQTGVSQNITIKVISAGNLSSLNNLDLNLDKSIQSYKETPTLKKFENNGLLFFEKTFKYSLVYTEPGIYQVPDLKLTYFDPEDSTYKVTFRNPFIVNVKGKSFNNTLSSKNEIFKDPNADKAINKTKEIKVDPTNTPQEKKKEAENNKYVEDGVFTKFLKYYSTGGLLFIIAILGAFITLIFYLLKSAKERQFKKELLTDIKAVKSYENGLEILKKLLAGKYFPQINDSSTIEHLKVLIINSVSRKTVVQNNENKINVKSTLSNQTHINLIQRNELLKILDLIEAKIYQNSEVTLQNDTVLSNEVNEFKKNLLKIIKNL